MDDCINFLLGGRSILRFRCPKWLLVCHSRKDWFLNHDIHLSSWTVPFRTNAFRLNKCARSLSMRDGFHPVTSEMDILPGVSRWNHCFLTVTMQPHWTYEESLVSPTRCSGFSEIEEIHLFHRYVWLPCSSNTTYSHRNSNSHDWLNQGFETTNEHHIALLVPLIVWRALFWPQVCLHGISS